MGPSDVATRIVNQIPAMVGYWDRDERCVFSNQSYTEWFAVTPERMRGITMRELLGPLYPRNVPHIQAVLRGEKQLFERRVVLPDGSEREVLVAYTPDFEDGSVRGFSVFVTDVTTLREREAALARTLKERDEAIAEAIALRGLLPICAGCKSIRDNNGTWHTVERYVEERTAVSFSHSMCPDCMRKWYPDHDTGVI
jgi:PAS domain S-box-containing protein